MTVQSDSSCSEDTQSCVSVPAQPEVVSSGTEVSQCHWRVTLSQASFQIHSASVGLVTMLSIGRPSSWQPMTDSLSSAWASHGLLHKSISSFHSQISVARFWMDFRFMPADHGAGGTWTFSSWLARGRACVGGTVMSPSLGTNCCKVMSRLGSPFLPAPTCQEAGSGEQGLPLQGHFPGPAGIPLGRDWI